MAEVDSEVKIQYIGDRIRYSVSWADKMAPDNPQYPAIAKELIEVSEWSIAADSDTTAVTIVEEGFDKDIGVAWCSVEADAGIVDGNVLRLNNKITTTGIQPHPPLSIKTSNQILTRQLRIRFKEC